jgi:hypothetical protein
MAQITSYTTTEAIRGSLGIDANDCPDNLMIDSNIELELLVDLDGWLSTHATIFSTGNTSGSTAEEKLLKDYVILYSQWFCATEMAARFLTFPQIVTDGKNQMNRFSKLDLERVKDMAAERMAKYRNLLDELVNGAVIGVFNPVAISIPDYDPVTNT